MTVSYLEGQKEKLAYCIKKTHYEDALILANNILELDRNESTSYQIVGKIYSLMKHYRKAIYNFIRAIELDPKCNLNYLSIAQSYCNLGENEAAISYLEKGIKIIGNDPLIFYNLGIIYQNIQNLDKAEVNFHKAIQLKPYFPDALNNLGNVYRKKEWPLDKVIKLSEKLIKYNKTPVFLIEKKYNELKNKIKNSIPSALFPEHETELNCPALVTCLGKRMDLAITIDNGVMHMLALSKTPIVSLFGPTDSDKFAPKYENSKILDSKKIYKSKNVSDITVEDVLQAVKQFLNF